MNSSQAVRNHVAKLVSSSVVKVRCECVTFGYKLKNLQLTGQLFIKQHPWIVPWVSPMLRS